MVIASVERVDLIETLTSALVDCSLLYYLSSFLAYSYLRGFRAHWVSAHSNLERLILDSIEFSVLKRALI